MSTLPEKYQRMAEKAIDKMRPAAARHLDRAIVEIERRSKIGYTDCMFEIQENGEQGDQDPMADLVGDLLKQEGFFVATSDIPTSFFISWHTK